MNNNNTLGKAPSKTNNLIGTRPRFYQKSDRLKSIEGQTRTVDNSPVVGLSSIKNNESGKTMTSYNQMNYRNRNSQTGTGNPKNPVTRSSSYASSSPSKVAQNKSVPSKVAQNRNTQNKNSQNGNSDSKIMQNKNSHNDGYNKHNATNYNSANRQTIPTTSGIAMSSTVNSKNNSPLSSKNNSPLSSRNNSKSPIKIGFLGGVGEIGKNMTYIEYGNQILIIDCGVSFPSEEMPGIDLVISDYSYIKDNASKVVGYVITHGHEDHIGALPYVLRDINAPVYASRLTIALIENKVREHNLKNLRLQTISTRTRNKIGNFDVEFVDVNHSIGDACALCIRTNSGTIFHSGDFKIDFRPIDGKMIDLARISEIGEEGVDLLLCESTNVERVGYTLSESDVGAKLEEVFADNIGRRIFVATFSSNIYRIQQIIDLAIKYERKVIMLGRSILSNIDAATRIGKFKFPKSTFVEFDKAKNLQDGNQLIICTGSQGEPSSVLPRLASGEFQQTEIGANDTVIFSSTPIPGNESMINRVINNLCKKGAVVVNEDVHASGHACIEELKTMHSLIKPKNFIPVHGEYRHLLKHAKLAESLGQNPNNILLVENGDVVELSAGKIQKAGEVKSGEVLIDGFGVGNIESVVLRDRKQLSEDGIAVITVTLNRNTHELLCPPVILTRGLIYTDEQEMLNSEIQKVVVDALETITKMPKFDIDEAKNLIKRPVRNYLNKKMGRMPIILVVFSLV